MTFNELNQSTQDFLNQEFFMNQYNTAFRGLENMQTKVSELQKYMVSFLSAVYAGVYYLSDKISDLNFYTMLNGLAVFSIVVAVFWVIQIVTLQNKARFKAKLIRNMEENVPIKYLTDHQEHNKKYEALYYVCDFFLPVMVFLVSITCLVLF